MLIIYLAVTRATMDLVLEHKKSETEDENFECERLGFGILLNISSFESTNNKTLMDWCSLPWGIV